MKQMNPIGSLLATSILFLFMGPGLAAQAADVPTPRTTVVTMKSLSYDPKEVRIKVGDTVTWKNASYSDHSATSIDVPPAFDTGMIAPGKESRPVHFDKAGSFYYHCSVHGKTMSGIITVSASSGRQ